VIGDRRERIALCAGICSPSRGKLAARSWLIALSARLRNLAAGSKIAASVAKSFLNPVWRSSAMINELTNVLPYDPGVLPTLPAPEVGDVIRTECEGLPPIKTIRQSIRNSDHPMHSSFMALRRAAIAAMGNRAWVFGAVALNLTQFGPRSDAGPSIVDYLAGVMDTLDGRCGITFTYLPIVFEDDCQVVQSRTEWQDDHASRYIVEVIILGSPA
jgi:hypothetical protein